MGFKIGDQVLVRINPRALLNQEVTGRITAITSNQDSFMFNIELDKPFNGQLFLAAPESRVVLVK